MPYSEAIRLAFAAIRTSKLRSFFTLLGIIVSVAFLVAVVAVIQGVNAYVRERIGGGLVRGEALPGGRPPPPVGGVPGAGPGALPTRPGHSPEEAPLRRRAPPP